MAVFVLDIYVECGRFGSFVSFIFFAFSFVMGYF